MAENLTNLVNDVKLDIEEAQDKLSKNYTQTHHNPSPKNQRLKKNLNRIQSI